MVPSKLLPLKGAVRLFKACHSPYITVALVNVTILLKTVTSLITESLELRGDKDKLTGVLYIFYSNKVTKQKISGCRNHSKIH